MDAIMSRTHTILLMDHGVFWRIASTAKDDITFIKWPENETLDILEPSQVPIFKEHTANPAQHKLPPTFHGDNIWSQGVLGRLIAGESVPKIVTIRSHTGLFGEEVATQYIAPQVLSPTETRVQVKKEKAQEILKQLKNHGPLTIELDTPSPFASKEKGKNFRCHCFSFIYGT